MWFPLCYTGTLTNIYIYVVNTNSQMLLGTWSGSHPVNVGKQQSFINTKHSGGVRQDVGGRGLMEQCSALLHAKVRCSLSVLFIIWCLPNCTSGKRNIRAFWTEKISIYSALEVKVNCGISAPCRICGYCLSRCCFVWPCCDSQITKQMMSGVTNCTDISSFEGIQTCLAFLPLWNTKESVKYY